MPPLYVFEDAARQMNATQIFDKFQEGRFSKLENNTLQPGFTTSVFWMVIDAGAFPPIDDLFFVLDNPHINILEWYYINQGQPKPALLNITGDFFPFSQRPVDYTLFAFPVQKNKGYYILKIDKHHESLQVDFMLQTKWNLLATSSRETLVNGLLSGVVLLIILFGLFLFFTTRDKVYLWYALYVLSISLWIWADKGLGFQYLWPRFTFFPSRSRPLFSVLNLMASIQFLQAFTAMPVKSWHHKFFTFVKIVMGLLAVLILLPIPYLHLRTQTMFFLRGIATVSFLSISVMLIYLVQRALHKSREARTYLLAISVFSVCALTEALHHMGVLILPDYMQQYSMFTGIVLEMIIITFGLATRFNSYRRDKELLLVQMNAQQKKLTDTIVEIQETERKALADQLHDELGSMLSLAALNISALPRDPKTEQAAETLQMVTHTVRNISHQLTPVAIEKYGFRHAVEDLVRMANTSGKLSVELVWIGFEQNQEFAAKFRNTLYRIIQELIQNVVKHAEATHALVQVIEHDETVNLMVEDNGRGIDEGIQKLGGLNFMRSIRSKVEYLEGQMNIETSDVTGTLINIEIPLPEKSMLK